MLMCMHMCVLFVCLCMHDVGDAQSIGNQVLHCFLPGKRHSGKDIILIQPKDHLCIGQKP